MNRMRLTVIFLMTILMCSSFSFGFVEISKPKDKEYVLWRDLVEGTSSATEESGLSVYLLIWPIEKNGPWQVNETATFPDGSWRLKPYFGDIEDIETTYKVIAMISDKMPEKVTLNDIMGISQSNRSQSIIVVRN